MLKIESYSTRGLSLYLIHSCSATWHITYTHKWYENEYFLSIHFYSSELKQI